MTPWARTGNTSPYYAQTLEAVCRHYGVSMAAPWDDLPEPCAKRSSMDPARKKSPFVYDDGLRRYETKKPFEGVITNIDRRWRETDSSWVREELARYQSDHPCEACCRLPAQIAGHGGQDRRPAYRQGLGNVDPPGARLVRRT